MLAQSKDPNFLEKVVKYKPGENDKIVRLGGGAQTFRDGSADIKSMDVNSNY